ncbi:MAG: sugar phosphate isomerase/epimerase [Lachnospiraceae bacterium]|nr:sugar phosphate isomerase/epimerase [Lachnospiraceae bacterium]
MKYAISNIAWSPEEDERMYSYLSERRMGLEIAPTRIFPWEQSATLGRMVGPYDKIREAASWAKDMYNYYGIKAVSMQSILNGIKANIFGSEKENRALIQYLKKAIDFAAAVKCPNLVFGCPLNRNIPNGYSLQKAGTVSIDFFSEITMYAAQRGVCIAMEANPTKYSTNFINYTSQAFDLVKCIGKEVGKNASKAIKVNFDLGTVLTNGESIYELLTEKNIALINHVHYSETDLKMLRRREEHKEIIRLLEEGGYENYISIEMRMPERSKDVLTVIEYLRSL